MKRGTLLLLVVVLALASPLRAADVDVEFLQSLCEHNWGEAAVDYLDLLREQDLLSVKLRDNFEYEAALTSLSAAVNGLNERTSHEYWERAKGAMKAFHDQRPDDARCVELLVKFGNEFFALGNRSWAVAEGTPAGPDRDEIAAKVRAEMQQAFDYHQQALERLVVHLQKDREKLKHEQAAASGKDKKVKPPTAAAAKALAQLQQRIAAWVYRRMESYFTQGRILVVMANTLDPGEPRNEKFRQASARFNRVYRDTQRRDLELDFSGIGALAHAWEGLCQEDLGNKKLAREIFDESVAIAPEPVNSAGRGEDSQDAIWATLFYHNFHATHQVEGAEYYLNSVQPWLTQYKPWKHFSGYQAIVLEVCETELALANQDPKRTALRTDALRRLQENARIPSPHAAKMARLLRDNRQDAMAEAKPNSLEEAVALATDAQEGTQWDLAAQYYQAALDLRPETPTAQQETFLKEAASGLMQAKFRAIGQRLNEAGKSEQADRFAQAIDSYMRLAREEPAGPYAATATAQACVAAQAWLAQAKQQENANEQTLALEQLQLACSFVLERWPDLPEADSARLILGKAALMDGEPLDAIRRLTAVREQSSRFPAALLLLGRAYSLLAQQASEQTPQGDPTSHPALVRAAKIFQQGVKRLQADEEQVAGKKAEAAAVGAQLNEALLYLAETRLQLGENKPARDASLALLKRTLKPARESPAKLEAATYRAFAAFVASQCRLAVVKEGTKWTRKLFERVSDTREENAKLAAFMKVWSDELKKHEILEQSLRDTAEASEREKVQQAIQTYRQAIVGLLQDLQQRQELPLELTIYYGTLATRAEGDECASEFFHRALKLAEQQPKLSADQEAQLMSVQAELVGLERRRGNFSGAVQAIDGLLAKHPTAVKYLMEKGRILTAWGESEPSRLSAAIKHWTQVRQMLASAQNSRGEFWEAVYEGARCLALEAERTKSGEVAKQGVQLLNSQILLSPTLGGDEVLVAKYQALLLRSRRLAAGQR